MATLTNNTIASTYTGLLSVNGAISTGSVEVVEDGAGTDTALWLSTVGAALGVDDTGADFRVYSATTNEGLFYDASEDEFGLLLTTKLKFHDIGGGEEIFASANGHLEINAGTTLDITAPTVDVNASSELNIDGNVDLNGTLDVSGTSTLGGTLTVNAGAVFNEASASVDFRVESNGNANALFVDGSANNIGIGTSSPDAAASLHIKSTSGAQMGSGVNAFIHIDGDQDSGIKILDTGTIRWSIFNSTGTGPDNLYIRDEEGDSGSGVYLVQDANDWTTTSDLNLKTDISSISDALSKVNSIRGVNFKWKRYKSDGDSPNPDRDRNRIGCIAQEVNEVLPEAVDTSKDGEWGVSYSTLIPLFVEAVKELSVSNDALKARIEVLEAV